MYRPWILAGAMLAGCAAYQPKPIAPAQLAQGFAERSLASEALRAHLERQLGHPIDSWPLARWDRTTLALAAGFYSPALEIARAQWNTAKAGVSAAGARQNPVLQFPFEYITNPSGTGHPYTTGPMLDLAVETTHRRGYRVEQAAFLAEAARLNLANEAWKVRSQVRDGLLAVFAETKRTQILERKVERQQHILQMWRRRQSLGAAGKPDVARAETLLAQAQSELAAANRAQLDARARLAAAVGVPLAILDAAPLDLSEFERAGIPPPAAEARRAAIFRRTDLLGALAEYETSQAALQVEIAKQYPDVHIGLGYTYDAGLNKISLGLASVTLPLLDRNQGAIAQAEARRSEAAARVAALQDGILIALDHALARYQRSLDALRLSDAGVAASGRELDSIATRFAAGALDRLALTQAQLDYQASAIDHFAAAVEVQQAAGMLEDAMQQPLPRTPAAVTQPERDKSR
jgi:outer membrane protein TolC